MTDNVAKLLNPRDTALVVIDKQIAYFDANQLSKRNKHLPEDSDKIVDKIDDFVLSARESGVMVVWTKMAEGVDPSIPNISLKIRTGPDNITTISKPDDTSYNIYGKTTPANHEKIIEKIRYDAFANTELDSWLKSHNIETLVLVGGYASRCVLATSFAANSLGYHVVIPEGVVINQKEDTDELPTFYKIINSILGYVVSSGDILALWDKEKN